MESTTTTTSTIALGKHRQLSWMQRHVTFLAILCGIAVFVFCVLLIDNIFRIKKIYIEIEENQSRYLRYHDAMNHLKKGTETRSEMARLYVMMGEQSYLIAYFKEMNDTRHCQTAMQILSTMPDAWRVENYLNRALQDADELKFLEYKAMKLVLVSQDNPLPLEEQPMDLQLYPLMPQDLALSPKEKLAKAKEMLLGADYRKFRDNVYGGIENIMTSAENNARDIYKASSEKIASFYRMQLVYVGCSITMLIGLLTLTIVLEHIRRNLQGRQMKQEHEIAMEKAKSFFFASVSHDIRTPLNAIIGFSDLLRTGVEDQNVQKQYLDCINMAGNTLVQLINDVLDLSKLDAGKMTFNYENTNFNQLLEQQVLVFKAQADQKKLYLDIKADTFPKLMVDPHRIRQILFNLIGNALKFTKRGGITIEASFTKDNDKEGTLIFAVVDTGIGIAADDLDNMMKPYVQLSNSKVSGGTGLGLPICKQLLERMDGELTVSSTIGTGSRFLAMLHHVKYTENVAEEQKETDKETAKSAMNLATMRLLLIDDSPVNLKVLKAMCMRVGITNIYTAENGQKALDVIDEQEIDFVLTDMWMPVMNGVEFVTALRNGTKQNTIPVYVVTADVQAMKNYRELGFTGLLLKPLNLDKLTELLKSLQL